MRGAGAVALRDQLMRAAMSVPTNIVEGSAHASPREFARFLQYALASISELEGHVQLARDLHMMSERDFSPFLIRIVDARKMLHGLLKSVKATSSAPHLTTGNAHLETDTENRKRETGNGKQETGNWRRESGNR